MKKVLALLVLVLGVTACDPRATVASFHKPERHDFPADSIVCFTYSTTISCVSKR